MEVDGLRTPHCSPELFDDLARELASSPRAFRVRVWGWSMNPTIRNGDVIVAEPVPADALRLGDIVLYSRPGGHVVHRLVAVMDGGTTLITRGDAHEYSDPPVRPLQVIARVRAVEHSGQRPLFAGFRTKCSRVAAELSRPILGFSPRASKVQQ